MAHTREVVRVDPSGRTTVVTVTLEDGSSPVAYTTERGATTIAMPATISEPTVFYFDEHENFIVSMMVDSVEVATPEGVPAVLVPRQSVSDFDDRVDDLEDASGTYDVLDKSGKVARRPATKALLRLTTPTTPQVLRWVGLGDSVADFKMRWIYPELNRAYGGGSTGAAGVAMSTGQSGTGWSLPGYTSNSGSGVTDTTTDFDAWFTGRVNRYATAGTRVYGIGGVTPTWDSLKVYYITGPSAPDGGTFKIQIDGVDEPGFTNVSAASASIGMGIATITRGSAAARSLTVTNLTGTHRVIGVAFFNSTSGGLVYASVSAGGLALDTAVSMVGVWANLATFLIDFQPDVVSLECKESSLYYVMVFATLLPIVRAAGPLATVIGIGSTPLASGDADQVIQNTQLRAACAANGCVYWDGYSPVVDYATLNALGWAGDGTHVADAASAFLGGLLVEELRLTEHPGLSKGRNVNAPVVTGTSVGAGTTSPTARLDVAGDISVAATATVRCTTTSGQNATLNLISGFSGVYGNASITATSAELRVSSGSVGGTNNFLSFHAGGAERVRIDSVGKMIFGGSAAGPSISSGSGTPEGSVTAPVGSVYMRTGGGAGTTFYVKESGTGNTGWVAK